MAKFGRKSKERLKTCDNDLQRLFEEVVKNFDCSVLEGVRSKNRQTLLFNSGKSTTMKSKHLPNFDGKSNAIDIVPYPIAWGEVEERAIISAFKERDSVVLKAKLMEYRDVVSRFYYFAGYVKGVAHSMGIKIRWGGDWDSDNLFNDQTFHDLPHFELIK